MKEFRVKYGLPKSRNATYRTFKFDDKATPTEVFQTANRATPEGKEVRKISFKGKRVFESGSWFRGPTYKEAFPPRFR